MVLYAVDINYDVVVHRIVTLVPEKKSMPSTKQEEVITLMLNINAMIATYCAYIEVVGYSSHILYSLLFVQERLQQDWTRHPQ